MTNCPICNRETSKRDQICVECMDEMPDTSTSFYSDLDVAKWAANRARKYYVCAHEQARRFLEQNDD